MTQDQKEREALIDAIHRVTGHICDGKELRYIMKAARATPAQPDKAEVVEDDGNLLARLGTDGHLWAEEMHKRFPSAQVDELIGWCCNMIMAGWDESHRRCMKRTPTEEELLEAVSALYGCREVLGDAANIQHAINCIEKYLPKKDAI